MILMDIAKDAVGRDVDGVILPELALSPGSSDEFSDVVIRRQAFFLTGVGEEPEGDRPGRNYLVFRASVGAGQQAVIKPRNIEQDKHHRWLLDRRQVVQYGLGGNLNPSRSWWEHTAVAPRKLTFLSMRPWLTMCVLICEDLARQDPAAELVRAIGPNLVLALLMDGPQLSTRWSARYATVLADDPGSSVLALTSLGMAQLSRPTNVSSSRNHVIALWKDAVTGVPVEVELPTDAEAVLLSLSVDFVEEWTADGRGDSARAGFPVLVGIHPIRRNRKV
jgi:hypothetical protein